MHNSLFLTVLPTCMRSSRLKGLMRYPYWTICDSSVFKSGLISISEMSSQERDSKPCSPTAVWAGAGGPRQDMVFDCILEAWPVVWICKTGLILCIYCLPYIKSRWVAWGARCTHWGNSSRDLPFTCECSSFGSSGLEVRTELRPRRPVTGHPRRIASCCQTQSFPEVQKFNFHTTTWHSYATDQVVVLVCLQTTAMFVGLL